GNDVTQTDILWKNEGDNATIHCSQTKGDLYFYMYWFRQLPGKTMELFPYPEGDVKGKISFAGDGSKYSKLTVSNVTLNDSGVYFCAASRHSAADSSQVNTENSRLSVNTCSQPPSKPSL
uniref:Ig-like domain-containing protein n=1 Tax=Mastacembelus armatus TaxID=205130 RepID=A0A7N9AQN4_9TELE